MFKVCLLIYLFINTIYCGPEEQEGIKYASKCVVCKVLATELEARLDETGKTSGVIEIGYSIDDIAPKKRKEYKMSELRLIESL